MIQTDKSHDIDETLLFASQTVIIKINNALKQGLWFCSRFIIIFFAPALVSNNEPQGGM